MPSLIYLIVIGVIRRAVVTLSMKHDTNSVKKQIVKSRGQTRPPVILYMKTDKKSKIPVSEKTATSTIIENRRRRVSKSIQEASSVTVGLSSNAASIATAIAAAKRPASVR